MANEAVLTKLFEDEAFVKELAEMETPEEVRDALNAKGAEITPEEARVIGKALSAQAEGELDADELEDVAGGAINLSNFINHSIQTKPRKPFIYRG